MPADSLGRSFRRAACGVMVLTGLVLAPARASDPPRPTVSGRLTDCGGLPVLELWGSPEEAGYALGYLLAEPTVRLFDEYVLSERIVRTPAVYEEVLLPAVRRLFVWTPEARSELVAVARGIRERLGAEGVRSKKLGRELTAEDLMVANTLADWLGLFCSTFSAWGALTADGQTLTARNLDFPSVGGMDRAQLMVIRRNEKGRQSWGGVSWPGLIGVYSGMNAAGVTVLMHDAAGLPATPTGGATPRALILREALEAAQAETYVEDVARVFRARRVAVGNNIHVSAPRRDGQSPAVVFEYDANAKDDGLMIRRAEDNPVLLADALWCTNHMRCRREPVACERFERLTRRLQETAQGGQKLDAAGALKLIQEVRQRSTLHSVVLEPARRVMHVQIPALSERVAELKLDDWLGRVATHEGDSSRR